MTHQPSPTNLSDELDEALEYLAESYYPEHEYNDIWRERNAELRAEAKAAITAAYAEAINEIIGEDETGPGHYPMVTKAYMKRNLLRAEQRQRLQRLLPTNGSDGGSA